MCRNHAREAIRFWTVVVERTGISKFDLEKATAQLSEARQELRLLVIRMDNSQMSNVAP